MKVCHLFVSALFLTACQQEPREIVAWPGMTPEEFNELNEDAGAVLNLQETDWIGINAPVNLTLRVGGKEITFEDRESGGGVQVASFLDRDGPSVGKFRVRVIAFNIGGGMERLENFHPLLRRYCDSLAMMAGIEAVAIPTPDKLAEKFEAEQARGMIDAGLCEGEGDSIGYSIYTTHYTDNWKHGGDFAYAFINGYLGMPLHLDELSSKAGVDVTGQD